MSSAAASFSDAFDFDEPARRKTPRKRASASKGARKRGKKAPRFAFNPQKVARYGAIGMSTTIALAIMVNALMLQKGHHPAPLFGKSIALGPSPVPAARPAPAPRVAPADDEAAAPAPTRAVAPPPPAPRQAIEDDAEPSSADAIGALIEGRAPAPAQQPKGESHTVLGAQRALAKLGFALKPNGTLGPQTRKAIAAFERDHHLPVKGELTHRLVKLLASESGVRID